MRIKITLAANSRILKIAIPSIVSNITVPLLGLVDLAIVGHLGSSAYIGAIAVGGLVFNIIYWLFAFLRMGTSGMTSQAYGKRDLDEVAKLLLKSVGSGLLISSLLLVFQYPIFKLAFLFVKATPEVSKLAASYFYILVWGAPAVLGLYGFSGWYIGMQNSRFPMYIAIAQNVVNVLVSVSLVCFFEMKVEGVAFGSLVAQYAGLLMALLLWMRYYKPLVKRISFSGLWERNAIAAFFRVNRDIFLRTLCLVGVTVYFTSAGAAQGNTILAVNALLMQFFILFSYFMDGFAYAGEALVGKYIGARNQSALHETVRQLFGWGLAIAIGFTLLYLFAGNSFLSMLTNENGVIVAAKDYSFWTYAIPLASVAGFMWDGVFIGATATRQMLFSMALAAAAFFITYLLLHPLMQNHALWLAFIVYLMSRGLVQTFFAKAVLRVKCL
jgi:MATE family multidrug resistance protein